MLKQVIDTTILLYHSLSCFNRTLKPIKIKKNCHEKTPIHNENCGISEKVHSQVCGNMEVAVDTTKSHEQVLNKALP